LLNVLICFGTRPEAIKLAPVVDELNKKKIKYKICATGQHKEMLQQVLDFFQITPDYDLKLMQPNQTLNDLSSKILKGVDNVIKRNDFNLVIVHGDTTTSSMAALAAFQSGVKVAHVEAGLRTFNKLSPFPEELNRQITARIADLHFAPTNKSKENLLKELIDEERIFVTGNTVVDALQLAKTKMESNYFNDEILELKRVLDFEKKIILVTGHRRENFGGRMIVLCDALKELAKNREVQIVFPVHLNPNVESVVRNNLSGYSNINLIKPVEYATFIWLMSISMLIISDSGGVQEEAPTFNVPVLVTRDKSERMEGVESGCSYLVGADFNMIVSKSNELLNLKKKIILVNPYGDGKSSNRIVNILLDYAK
jgi:UDP-N-acetylglucosamine 2-epimerase (non-hydrolysing)